MFSPEIFDHFDVAIFLIKRTESEQLWVKYGESDVVWSISCDLGAELSEWQLWNIELQISSKSDETLVVGETEPVKVNPLRVWLANSDVPELVIVIGSNGQIESGHTQNTLYIYSCFNHNDRETSIPACRNI